MFGSLKRLLANRTFVLVAGFVGGLLFSGVASAASFLTMPALAVVLTASMIQLTPKDFAPPRDVAKSVLVGFLLNFVLLGAVILALARWLMPTEELWIGYVLLAAGPPGVAVIPFTHVLRGDVRFSLHGTFGLYLASLALTPALVAILTGSTAVAPGQLARTILVLVLTPFVLAQSIKATTAGRLVMRWRSNIINWGFFLVVFTVVGLNRSVFLSQPGLLLRVSVPAVASTFGLWLLVDGAGRRLGVADPTRHSAMLLATIKNSAFASAVGLSFFGEASSIPGAVVSAWYALYFIYLGIRGGRLGRPSAPGRPHDHGSATKSDSG